MSGSDDRDHTREQTSVQLEDCRRVLCGFLEAQVALLDSAIVLLLSPNRAIEVTEDVVHTTVLMIQGVGVSAHSILALSRKLDMQVRDSLSIARSVVETAVNVAYIISGGAPIARRAQQHAMQKIYRDIERSGKIGPITFKVGGGLRPDLTANRSLAEALKEFSDNQGREIRDWTRDNLDKRLNLVEQRYDKAAWFLSAAVLSIYRYSSEILHGTYFGVLYFWTGGRGERIVSREDAEFLFLTSHMLSAISSAFFALQGLVEVVSSACSDDFLRAKNSEYMKLFSEFMEEHFAKLSSPE